MIEAILLRQTASYDPTGERIENLRKVNFIYGSNGSGKTTISNFLHDQGDARFLQCQLKWKSDEQLDTLVYNKEFRERNFNKGVIDGVFTLGQATKEQILEIENFKNQATELKNEILQKRENIKKLEIQLETDKIEFKEYVWHNAYKKHESHFKEAFRGVALQKEPFLNEFIRQFKENMLELQSKELLVEKANTLLGNVPVALNKIFTIDIEDFSQVETHSIWKKRIIGKADVDIAKLIQKLNINDWVNQGKDYLDKDSSTCPFCQKDTIDDSFRAQMNDFFDKEFLENSEKLKSVSLIYKQSIAVIVETLKEIEKRQEDLNESKLDLDKFKPILKSIELQASAVNELIESKRKEPSRSIELPSIQNLLETILSLVSNANNAIDKHNKMVVNYQDEKRKLIDEIWKFLIDQEHSALNNYTKKADGLNKALIKTKEENNKKGLEWKQLDNKIKELNKNVTSVQPTVDEINRLLKFYGFLNFEIVPLASDPNLYQILREDGNLAEISLSEGEITFITFLYFFQLIKGGLTEESVNNDRVVVIDDPISSLDSSVLFVISTLIKELIKKIKNDEGNIKQIILLTHNVYFHKEVSYAGLRAKGESPYFWILRKKDKVSKIQCYEENNPIHSSYELLWSELRNWKESSGITVQNIMRRILENYYSILGNKRDDYVINSFTTYEEQEICRSLLSWTNEGSHTLPDDFYIEMPDDTIEKYLHVFKEIFNKTQNSGHYSMMMKEEQNTAI